MVFDKSVMVSDKIIKIEDNLQFDYWFCAKLFKIFFL